MLLNILCALQNSNPFLLKKKVFQNMLTSPGHGQNQKPKLMYNPCAKETFIFILHSEIGLTWTLLEIL